MGSARAGILVERFECRMVLIVRSMKNQATKELVVKKGIRKRVKTNVKWNGPYHHV